MVGYYIISIIAIVVSVISGSYYLKVIGKIYFEGNEEFKWVKEEPSGLKKEFTNTKGKTYKKMKGITNIHSVIISSITILIVLFILEPTIILNSCNIIALSLYNK